jgi:CheY-like chemotaxis protein
MSKILLVEDDNNLREIYEARLQAEGYDIVSARDGEEALTVAMKERPDLIISDVMMPKISGFDMLDIIRSTEETKNVKVIMMTALSQAEDKERATKLGADRYLVKSQVTLEDVAKVAREVLNGDTAQTSSTDATEPETETPKPPSVTQAPTVEAPTAVPTVPAPSAIPVEPDTPTPAPSQVDSVNTATPAPQTDSPALSAISPTSDDSSTDDPLKKTDDEESAIAAQIESFIETNKTEEVPAPANETDNTETPTVPITPETDEKVEVKPAESTGKKVIQPLSDPTASKGPDLEGLLEKEAEKEQMAEIARSVAAEKSSVADELSAEAALRSAARDPKTQPEAEVHSETPQVAITENGDLKVQSPPEETPAVQEDPTPPIDTSDVPKVEPTEPVIPHSNGSSIDGVVAQPQAQPTAAPTPTPPQPASPAPSVPAAEQKPPEVDPNSIAL